VLGAGHAAAGRERGRAEEQEHGGESRHGVSPTVSNTCTRAPRLSATARRRPVIASPAGWAKYPGAFPAPDLEQEVALACGTPDHVALGVADRSSCRSTEILCLARPGPRSAGRAERPASGRPRRGGRS
jgi:hypothetical protein